MKYLDAEKLYKQVDSLMARYAEDEREFEDDTELSIFYQGKRKMCSEILSIIDSLQQENEIVEFTFKGGTYRVNGEEHAFKGGKAKVIILEINQEGGNE